MWKTNFLKEQPAFAREGHKYLLQGSSFFYNLYKCTCTCAINTFVSMLISNILRPYILIPFSSQPCIRLPLVLPFSIFDKPHLINLCSNTILQTLPSPLIILSVEEHLLALGSFIRSS